MLGSGSIAAFVLNRVAGTGTAHPSEKSDAFALDQATSLQEDTVTFVTVSHATFMLRTPIGYWCSVAAHQYFIRLQEKLAGLDITNWFFVLLPIDEHKGKLSQQELADALDLDKVAMTRALDHFAENGYVERCACEGDRRKFIVKLTPKARPAVKAIRKAYDELNDDAMKGMNKKERTLFQQQLTLLVENMRPTKAPARMTTKRIPL